MNALIDLSLHSSRTVLLLFTFILVAGSMAYVNMPKESDPDVAIPILYVSMSHEGISPEDAERLLVRPMEKELRTIEGIKELTAVAGEGHASVTLEFDAGFDSDRALQDVLQKVDIAKSKLPADTEEPIVNEVNVALFPVIVVTLAGDVPERTLLATARALKDAIEGVPDVLKVEIAGNREEVLEVIIDPLKLESYQLSYEAVFSFFSRNNQLVAAGALDNGQGRFNVKVPGVFESLQDMLSVPIKVENQQVVTITDVAEIRRTFKDPVNFARVNGKPALALEVSKRVGTNIIETIEQTKAVVAAARERLPANVEINFIQDRSSDVRNILSDLQNNLLSAILMVMIIVVASLGLRSAVLVAISVPGSFLMAILVLQGMGLTMNIVVLFSLILASGIVVDGAIIVVEYADCKMNEGFSRFEAYGLAAKRMGLPVIGSISTTLVVFIPLLFWPGVLGEFMKYLPLTVIAVLVASLLVALIFMPTLGSLFGKPNSIAVQNFDTIPLNEIRGVTGWYVGLLQVAVRYPLTVLIMALTVLVSVNIVYAEYGKGVEFFPDVEPERALVYVHGRGDLSVVERDMLVREVEQRLIGLPFLASVYTQSGLIARQGASEDVIGVLQLEFTDWQTRPKVREIFAVIREKTGDIAGVQIELRKEEGGPSQGKPIYLEVHGADNRLLAPAVGQVVEYMKTLEGVVDIEDNRPLAGIDWKLLVDRVQASRFGADILQVGNGVQLVTNGIKVGEYRPDDADEELDIRIRYPMAYRSLDQLDQLRIQTNTGLVPISLFVERLPQARTGTLNRSDERRIFTVQANVAEGVLVDDKLKEIHHWLESENNPLDPQVKVTFKGEDRDQREAEEFLGNAFLGAMFLIAIILVAQFNNFYQTFLILTAVIMATIGVLLGLLITQQPFGIVMCGIGIIALAGIVVGNNIVLIDTYNILRAQGLPPHEAVVRTGAQRLRPVMLTTVTTILGLIPMVLNMNIDLFTRTITFGAPSTQWWTQLSTAIAGGLTFATILTLVVTPCLLVIGTRRPSKQN